MTKTHLILRLVTINRLQYFPKISESERYIVCGNVLSRFECGHAQKKHTWTYNRLLNQSGAPKRKSWPPRFILKRTLP